jgi:tetratricopeptide (TPR) repeat protein
MTKYLSTFYSYKFVPEAFRLKNQRSGDKPAALEQQIQAYLTRGHQEFFQGQYQNALQSYQNAYSLIYRFLHPDFPDRLVALNPEIVQNIRVSDSLLAASAEVIRFREAAGPKLPIVAPGDPPRELTAVVEKFGTSGTVTLPSRAQNLYKLATNYLQIGATSQAQVFLKRAFEVNQGQDRRLEADLHLATGVALMRQPAAPQAGTNAETGDAARRRLDDALSSFTKAQAGYLKLQLKNELAAASNNLGVLHTLNGKAKDAGAAFKIADDNLPLDLGRTMVQPLNPGTASTMVRPMGSSGLGLFVRTLDEHNWSTIPPAGDGTAGAERLGVFVDNQIVNVNLAANPVAELKQKIYQTRVTATTLGGLRTFEELDSNFVAYLTHIQGFTIPMSIGDCYLELGEFDKALLWYQRARDYSFLNQLIEAPAVWLKMANAFLRWGDLFFKNGDKAEARARYEKIVRITAPNLDLTSPLYLSPVFDGLRAQVEAILAAPQPLDVDVHNPAIARVVLLAQANLQNIASGIDVPLLSLDREQIPVFTFEYLQNVARYFAEHAIQAERTYINFKTSAEQEEFTRSMLENAVDLERANETLEQKKVQIAADQKAAMDANLAYAQKQLDNARGLKSDFAGVSLQENALDAEITYVGAPTTEYDFSGYGQYGISDGEHRADEVLRTLTERRRELSREFELRNMDRRISELEAARVVAQAQQTIAQHQVEAAQLQSQIATLRRQQAEQQLTQFDSQEFTPDLWNRLANEIKAISESYLQQAIVIAQLMEQTFEFEIGDNVDIIKPNYTRNDLSGLLAGDFLLRDIDSFTFLRIILGQKKQPMKEVISLADRYPVQFLREFQRTGQMNFRTELSDFDRNYPGAYQPRIKRVEVVVEGLIGHEGIHGTLTNTGLCLTRLRSGAIKMRLLEPETLLLSQYRIGPDGIVFTPDQEMLAIFENSPVVTSWVLEISPSVNDLIYNFITDVKLMLYYEAFFDDDLKPLVLEELATTQVLSGRRTVALRYELFDEFFAFQDTGEVRFTLRDTMLPFYHTDPRIREMTILLRTDEGVSPVGFVLQVAAGGTNAEQTTDADGAISTGTGAALNSFVGQPWLQEWTITLPRTSNQARFDAGFQLAQVNNIVVVAEYEFTPRRIPGEPFLLLRDRFTDDSLAEFDVVDDPQATQDGPSAWVHNVGEGRIEQQAGIFGGPSAVTDTGPVKPGTYLVRRTDAAISALPNLIITCRLRSEDEDGIGLVFRYQDVDNFYFFLMDSRRNFRRVGKKVGGVFQELSNPAVVTSEGFIVGQDYSVKVRLKDNNLAVFLDDAPILSGKDASLPAGRVGFFSWANSGAQFDDLQIIEI